MMKLIRKGKNECKIPFPMIYLNAQLVILVKQHSTLCDVISYYQTSKIRSKLRWNDHFPKAILDGLGTTITAQKVYPIMTPQAQKRERIRNGDKTGVIRDEIIIFYGMAVIKNQRLSLI